MNINMNQKTISMDNMLDKVLEASEVRLLAELELETLKKQMKKLKLEHDKLVIANDKLQQKNKSLTRRLVDSLWMNRDFI